MEGVGRLRFTMHQRLKYVRLQPMIKNVFKRDCNAVNEPWRVQYGMLGFLSGKDGACHWTYWI